MLEQLKLEADYDAELRAATEYRLRLVADPDLWVPAVIREHCTSHIIASEFSAGVPLDAWATDVAPQAQRDHVAAAHVRLAVRELFEMGLVQTDPNFGNYPFDAGTGKVTLLNFGAAERVQPMRITQLAELGRAMRDGDIQRIATAATVAGFIQGGDTPGQRRAVVEGTRAVLRRWLRAATTTRPAVPAAQVRRYLFAVRAVAGEGRSGAGVPSAPLNRMSRMTPWPNARSRF